MPHSFHCSVLGCGLDAGMSRKENRMGTLPLMTFLLGMQDWYKGGMCF